MWSVCSEHICSPSSGCWARHLWNFPSCGIKLHKALLSIYTIHKKPNITYRLQTFRNKNSTYCKALMVIGKLQEDLEHLTLPQHQLAKITSKSSSTEQVVKLNMSLSKLHVQAEFPTLPTYIPLLRKHKANISCPVLTEKTGVFKSHSSIPLLSSLLQGSEASYSEKNLVLLYY